LQIAGTAGIFFDNSRAIISEKIVFSSAFSRFITAGFSTLTAYFPRSVTAAYIVCINPPATRHGGPFNVPKSISCRTFCKRSAMPFSIDKTIFLYKAEFACNVRPCPPFRPKNEEIQKAPR